MYKIILAILCFTLSGCVAFVSKKASPQEEAEIALILHRHSYKINPGTVQYYGKDFNSARQFYGYAWSNNTLGHFIIINNKNNVEVFWSIDGEFPELDRRLYLSMPPHGAFL